MLKGENDFQLGFVSASPKYIKAGSIPYLFDSAYSGKRGLVLKSGKAQWRCGARLLNIPSLTVIPHKRSI